MCATSVIKKLSKVNEHPMGENSPNLITLIGASVVLDQGDQMLL
jgi:hypothetical protein